MKKILISYMHLYKCAGTSMNWIFKRNFPDSCLFAEHKKALTADQFESLIIKHLKNNPNISIVSSHVLTGISIIPAEIKYCLLRNPLDRIVSAFKMDLRRNIIGSGLTFNDYLKRPENQNFQSRRITRDYKFDFSDSKDLKYGVVDLFDESMLLLEEMSANCHVKFDGSYKRILNAASTPNILISEDDEKEFNEVNADDIQLYKRAKNKILEDFNRIKNKDVKFSNFKERCSSKMPVLNSYGQGPNHFDYLG